MSVAKKKTVQTNKVKEDSVHYGMCKHDLKKCDHWKWCKETKHGMCGSFKQKKKKSGSGVSCGKCLLKQENRCNFICFRRDINEGNVKIEVEEVD